MSIDLHAQEALLHAWMQMSVCIRGNRILSDLSFNEIMLCGTLYQQELTGGSPLTATDLGERMKLLRSQMNHILTALEKNGLLERTRSQEDRRVVHIRLTEAGRQRYCQEHQRVMALMEQVCRSLGEDDTHRLTTLINKATHLVTQYTER